MIYTRRPGFSFGNDPSPYIVQKQQSLFQEILEVQRDEEHTSEPVRMMRRKSSKKMPVRQPGSRNLGSRKLGSKVFVQKSPLHIHGSFDKTIASMDVVGFNTDQLSITIDGHLLTIFGNRQNKLGETFVIRRRISLKPDLLDVSSIHTSISDGVLEITVLKKQPKLRVIRATKISDAEPPCTQAVQPKEQAFGTPDAEKTDVKENKEIEFYWVRNSTETVLSQQTGDVLQEEDAKEDNEREFYWVRNPAKTLKSQQIKDVLQENHRTKAETGNDKEVHKVATVQTDVAGVQDRLSTEKKCQENLSALETQEQDKDEGDDIWDSDDIWENEF